MNIVADESVDRPIVERLRQDGHDVVSIAELVAGIRDDAVLQQANDRSAVLMTGDKDFGELVFRLNRVTHGVVLLRLEGLAPATKATAVAEAVRAHAAAMLGSFTVIPRHDSNPTAHLTRSRPRSFIPCLHAECPLVRCYPPLPAPRPYSAVTNATAKPRKAMVSMAFWK
jgi:predicted nuclease of predicted toxin-antitoxin system